MAPASRGVRVDPQQRRWAQRAARHGRSAGTLGTLAAVALLVALACRAWRADNAGAVDRPLAVHAFVLASKFAKQAAPPVCALTIGFGLYSFGGASKGAETAAIVLIYFGAQTGMNLYMKSVFSQVVVSAEEGLKGIPIGFLLSSIQQFVAFLTFCGFLLVGRLFSTGYQVKKLTTTREYLAVVCFSVTFALNIGLNNFSLSLLAISINMLIRSCLPLSTAVSQFLVGMVMDQGATTIAATEWVLMLAGVGCAGLATYAKSEVSAEESASLVLGVIVCIASIFSGALNMVLAGILGTKMKLNPLDTTCYMALPAGLVLLVPALMVSHPMSKWPGFDDMTDWQVLREVMERKPMAMTPVLFSGLLAFVYNILQYTLVHKLSASYATFAGNFNKAATVALSLALGLESVPPGGYGRLFLLAVVGNIGAFTMYSVMKSKGK